MKNLCLLVAFFVTNILPAQSTYTVDNKPNAKADFNNLQTAINTVAAGSILLVQGSSTSYGEIEINKKIIIKGPGFALAENPNTQVNKSSAKVEGLKFEDGSSSSSISGFHFEGGIRIQTQLSDIKILDNYVGYIYGNLSNTNILVKNNYIFDRFHYSFNIGNYSVYLGSGSIVSGNYVAGFVVGEHLTVSNNICYLWSTTSGFSLKSSDIYNNIILKNARNSLSFISTAFENSVYNNIIIKEGVTEVANNKVIEPSTELFIQNTDDRYSTDGKYILSSDSPAKGAGVGGVDCGMFAGGYKLSGIPDIPNIYEFNVPITGYSNSTGIQVNVKVKSNN